jgi:hypothetical protein
MVEFEPKLLSITVIYAIDTMALRGSVRISGLNTLFQDIPLLRKGSWPRLFRLLDKKKKE